MNERIARLRTKNLTQQPEICSERAQIVTRAYEKYKDLPPLLLRAKTFEAIMQEMTIWIADDELIVGNQAKMAKGAPVYPEFSVDWIIKELDSFSTRTVTVSPVTQYSISAPHFGQRSSVLVPSADLPKIWPQQLHALNNLIIP